MSSSAKVTPGHGPSRPDPSAAAGGTSVVRVRTLKDGPLQITGPVQLIDHTGAAYELGGRRTVMLCRCGGSAAKPFCDGTHSRIGFVCSARAPTAPGPQPPDGRDD